MSEEVGIPHAYREEDPDRTLQELWVRADDGCGRFAACRNKHNALLVTAGDHFAFADQENGVFVAGTVIPGTGFVIEMSAADASLEGTVLTLQTAEFISLPGATLDINDIFHV